MSFPILVSIEGNIGSGKSTLVKKLKAEYEPVANRCGNIPIIFVDEPVDEWTSVKDKDDKDVLQHFYEDQTKYAFSFQMMAYITRLKKLKDAIDNNPVSIIVMERSLGTDKHVFAKMLYEDGKMNEIEYQIYNKWYDAFCKTIPKIHYIHLNTPPDVCHQRINKRNRTGEGKIEHEYLEKCDKYHSDWLEKEKKDPSLYVVDIEDNNDSEIHCIWENMNDMFYQLGDHSKHNYSYKFFAFTHIR